MLPLVTDYGAGVASDFVVFVLTPSRLCFSVSFCRALH